MSDIPENSNLLGEMQCAECFALPASGLCVKCEVFMCQFCFDEVHKISKYMKNHQFNLLTSLTISKGCKEHGDRSFEYFCKDDGTEICADCVVMGKHRNHDVCSLEDVNKKLLDEKRCLSLQANDTVLCVQQLLDCAHNKILHCQEEETKIVHELREHFDKLCFILKTQLEKLEKDYHQACAERVKALNEFHQDLSLKKKSLEGALSDINALDLKCLKNSQLLDNLRNTVTCSYTFPVLFQSHIQLDLDATKLIDCMKLHGRVITIKEDNESSEKQDTEVGFPLSDNIHTNLNAPTLLNSEPEAYELHSPPAIVRMTDIPQFSHLRSIHVDQVTDLTCATEIQERKERFPLRSVSVAGDHVSVRSEVSSKTNNSVHSIPRSYSPACNISLHRTDQGQAQPLCNTDTETVEKVAFKKTCPVSCSPLDKLHFRKFNSSQPSNLCFARAFPLSGKENLNFDQVKDSCQDKQFSNTLCRNVNSKFTSHMEPVIVSHVCHPGLFWVHLTKDLDQLQRLSQSIQDYCTSNQHKIDKNRYFKIGDLVLAKFHDKIWYRAKIIKSVEPIANCLTVCFLDYGNIDTVPVSNIQSMEPNICKVPYFVLCCTLSDVVPLNDDFWSAEAVETFARMVSNMTLMMNIVKQEEPLHIKLSWPLSDKVSDDQVSYVSDALVFHGIAKYLTSGANEQCLPISGKRILSKFIPPILPDIGEAVPVVITNVVSPHEFTVRITKKELSQFTEMSAEIQNTCMRDTSNVLCPFLPSVGMPCLVNFGNENQSHWSRAEVTKLLENGQVQVRCIDSGSLDVVSVFRLKKLLDKFKVIPAQAINCCLADVEALNGKPWTESAFDFLKSLSSRRLYMTVKQLLKGPLLSVYISTDVEFSSENLINFLLVSQGLAVVSYSSSSVKLSNSTVRQHESPIVDDSGDQLMEPKKSVCDKLGLKNASAGGICKGKGASSDILPRVIVSSIISPDELYVQSAMSRHLQHLDELMHQINLEYQNRQTVAEYSWKPEDECVVKYSKNGRWYRAKITAINNQRVEVILLDYGFRDQVCVKDVFPIDDKFMSVAWFSSRCHLIGIEPSSGGKCWPETTCDLLQQTFFKKECQLVVKNLGNGISNGVDLLFMETVMGSALTADHYVWASLTDWLVDRLLARAVNSKKDVPKCISDYNGEKSNEMQGVISESEDAELHATLVSQPSIQSDCKALGILQRNYLPPEVPNSMSSIIVVTFVDSDGCIYGQEVKDDLSQLKEIMDRVRSHYRLTLPESNCHIWKLGQPVAAQFTEDNLYYRAKIVGFSDYGIEVEYVDYGNREVVRKERLRLLDETFLSVPIQCLPCNLYKISPATADGKWPPTTIKIIDEYINNIPCKMIIRGHDKDRSRFFVDLHLPNGKDIGKILQEKGLAMASDGTEMCDLNTVGTELSPEKQSCAQFVLKKRLPERKVSSPYLQMALPSLGDILHVTVTEVELPNIVYIQHIQLTDSVESPSLKKINEHLNCLIDLSATYVSDVNKYPPLSVNDLLPGTPCVAQYSVDKCWYRAEIICCTKINSDIFAGMRFVDYGSSEHLTIDRLRAIPDEHLRLPMQCWRCLLNGVKPIFDSELYINHVKQKLVELFKAGDLVAIVKNVLDDGSLVIDLFNRDLFLMGGPSCPLAYQNLIELGLLENFSKQSDENILVESEDDVGSVSIPLDTAAE